mmetsp:Transcript_23604/g.79304  ORF Transcript_23604/g.79304 Transcript_23604/m.79304 type:complete len:240 (-) Transcript_23604:172-891(-)
MQPPAHASRSALLPRRRACRPSTRQRCHGRPLAHHGARLRSPSGWVSRAVPRRRQRPQSHLGTIRATWALRGCPRLPPRARRLPLSPRLATSSTWRRRRPLRHRRLRTCPSGAGPWTPVRITTWSTRGETTRPSRPRPSARGPLGGRWPTARPRPFGWTRCAPTRRWAPQSACHTCPSTWQNAASCSSARAPASWTASAAWWSSTAGQPWVASSPMWTWSSSAGPQTATPLWLPLTRST